MPNPVVNRRLSIPSGNSMPVPRNPTTTAWLARISGASANTIRAHDIFWNGMDAQGLSSLMKFVWTAPNEDLTNVVRFPYMSQVNNNKWILNNFVQGDMTLNGLIGNGSNKFIDTNDVNGIPLLPSSIWAQTNAGMTMYYTVAPTSAGETTSGSNDGASTNQFTFAYRNTGHFFWVAFDGSTAILDGTMPAGFTGYVSANQSPGGGAVYIANSTTSHHTLVSGAGTGGTVPGHKLYLFANDANGSTIEVATVRLSFIAGHQALTSGQSQVFFSLVQALRQNLLGGFV